ncbi:MAG: hypothetical protein HY672_00185 [Chloroflexi bacterium]|nr:hypothetical protein [Chloroflexota bacterium]
MLNEVKHLAGRQPHHQMLRVLVLAGLWALSIGLTVTWSLTDLTESDLFRGFFLVWAGITLTVVWALGHRVECLGKRSYHLLAGLLLVIAVFYVIGRPIELAMLKRTVETRTFPAIFLPGFEVGLSIIIGLALAALYTLAYWVLTKAYRVLTKNGNSPGKHISLTTGAALYVVTGLLLWFQSSMAWFIVRVVAGVAQEPFSGTRLIDGVGPGYVFWYTLVWPAVVTVCCG